MSEIPSIFIASWNYEKHEKFDEYMEKRGTSWIIRKFVLSQNRVLTWKSLGNGQWVIEHSKPKDFIYPFKLGEEFTAKGFDQVERKMLYTVNGDSIIERWRKTDGSSPDEISTYTIHGDCLIQSMVCGDATCKKFFKRKN